MRLPIRGCARLTLCLLLYRRPNTRWSNEASPKARAVDTLAAELPQGRMLLGRHARNYSSDEPVRNDERARERIQRLPRTGLRIFVRRQRQHQRDRADRYSATYSVSTT